jgi:hypothetical protein
MRRGEGSDMGGLGIIAVVAIVGLVAWGVYAKADRRQPIYWSSVSVSQLELHHKMTVAMADRVHLDPSIREALRHQVEILKAIGVAGTKEEAIDVTEETPTVAQLSAYGPRADGGAPLLRGPEIKKSDHDEWIRARGYRVMGDEGGFGVYEKEGNDE